MLKRHQLALAVILGSCALPLYALPAGFVYLSEVDPTIQQDMRYATAHNFIGRPIAGYKRGTCILTKQAAEALKQVQNDLEPMGLSLKVYDCYRPQMAVNDFYQWSQQPKQQQMKAEFYPRVDKSKLFDLGYIAQSSGHTRGSTIDLTIVQAPLSAQASYTPGQPLTACYAPFTQRFRDNSINMGTGYDCMDATAHPLNKNIETAAYRNRMLLRYLMLKNGFTPYDKEWWHFTLKKEPYPKQYFNFPVQ